MHLYIQLKKSAKSGMKKADEKKCWTQSGKALKKVNAKKSQKKLNLSTLKLSKKIDFDFNS